MSFKRAKQVGWRLVHKDDRLIQINLTFSYYRFDFNVTTFTLVRFPMQFLALRTAVVVPTALPTAELGVFSTHQALECTLWCIRVNAERRRGLRGTGSSSYNATHQQLITIKLSPATPHCFGPYTRFYRQWQSTWRLLEPLAKLVILWFIWFARAICSVRGSFLVASDLDSTFISIYRIEPSDTGTSLFGRSQSTD